MASSTLNPALNGARRGNVAVTAALCMLPIGIMLGAAADFAMARNAKRSLQEATDNSALAAAHTHYLPKPVSDDDGKSKGGPGKGGGTDDDDDHKVPNTPIPDKDRKKAGQDTFTANVKQAKTLKNAVAAISVSGDGAIVKASAKVQTTFMALTGVTELTVRAEAEAQASSEGVLPIELVLAMDATNSMGIWGGWSAGAEAMKDFISGLYDGESKNDDVVVTYLPFQDRVNIGKNYANLLDGPPPSGWNGCFAPREEHINGLPYNLSARSPSVLPFKPSFVGEGNLGALGGGYPNCPKEMAGPTTHRKPLEDAIDATGLTGTGRLSEALVWSWRLLSPEWKGQWKGVGSKYPAPKGKIRKVALLITDSKTEAYRYEGGGNGVEAGTPHNEPTKKAFDLFKDICTRMKADGIEVHVMLVGTAVPAVALDPWKACASPNGFHTPETLAEFKLSLAEVGAKSRSLRLVK